MKSSASPRARTNVPVTRLSAATRISFPVLNLSLFLLLIILTAIFVSFRSADIGRLPALAVSFAQALTSEKVFSPAGGAESLAGAFIALLIAASWYGAGHLLVSLCTRRLAQPEETGVPVTLDVARKCGFGAGMWSLLWFLLGLSGLYNKPAAIAALTAGLMLFALSLAGTRGSSLPATENGVKHVWLWRIAFVVIAFAVLLALIAALAPPAGKDALIYHLSLPKAFLSAGGLVEVPYNIAGYYAHGVEMNGMHALLLGSIFNARIAEAAFGATTFVFYPLLLLAVYGWARGLSLTRGEAGIAAAIIATVPTVWLSAATGYTDLALTLYLALLIQAAAAWWQTMRPLQLIWMALALGLALTVKLTAVFSVFPLLLLFLLRARQAENDAGSLSAAGPGRILWQGLLMLAGGGLLGSQWYLRNWISTGSPIFPFYMKLWPGSAPGWDAERSQMYSLFLSNYGGSDKGPLDYLATPFYLALTAQPELHTHYDGVMGISFLLGLPLLLFMFYRATLCREVMIAVCFSAALYLCWLFSSEQLRFLLPALPGLAVAMVAAVAALRKEEERKSATPGWLMLAGAAMGLLVICAWFLAINPVRAVAGGEQRAAYLTRRLDYYPFYEIINAQLPADARVWLINMRRDTYHIERPYFSDYLFEDYTITKLVLESRDAGELRARVREMGITHLLLRHDVLLDYARSPIVHDRRSEAENRQKLELLNSFLKEGTRLIRSDQKFMLIELPSA